MKVKKLMRYLLLIFLNVLIINAQDSMNLAFVSGVSKEATAILRVGNYHFECKNYGIMTLNELILRKELSSSCKKELGLYQKRHPLDVEFSARHLKIEQKYHYEIVGQECILYSSGQMSYSEILLKNGLAIMKPLFSDDIWRYRHKQAQSFARIEKKGVWENSIVNLCIAELYKN